jgi:hypothetical protein
VRLTLAFILFLVLPAADASAACLPITSPVLLPVSDMVGRDPTRALRMAESVLASGESFSPEELGRLFALKAESHGRLSQAEEARRTAALGLEQPLAADGEARAELLWLLATNTFRPADLVSLRAQVEQAAATTTPATGRRICLAIALGSIQRMTGNFGEAAQFLFNAYASAMGKTMRWRMARRLAFWHGSGAASGTTPPRST